jgi:two-component system, OmpR family, sensor histidine kinase KdpD
MFFDKNPDQSSGRQYAISLAAIFAVALACYPVTGVIGYRSVALLLLFAVSVLSLQMELRPVLAAATASALIWNFFFIPPHFTFHIGSMEDGLMFGMYFLVALLNGVFSARIRRAEEQARQKEERARAAKLYDTLFNSLSHELRTPIATILGASDNLLSENTSLDEDNKKELFKEINTASERLNRLVDNLLNMSRLDSGFIQPKLDWCDVRELVFTVINGLRKELKGHKLEVEIPEDLPLFRLDFGLMEQVLTNILYNDSLYTPIGAAISVRCEAADNQCVIVVVDAGPGFPKGDIELVFEKFYRSKNARTGGVGLGLSIAKGFVDAHHGSIKLENVLGGGAKFTIAIPSEILEIEKQRDW